MYSIILGDVSIILLSLAVPDLEFVKTFLFTYQAFTTPEKLLRKLIERYNVVCPEGMPLKEFDVMRQTIQARVINALRLWVDLSVDYKGLPLVIDHLMLEVSL